MNKFYIIFLLCLLHISNKAQNLCPPAVSSTIFEPNNVHYSIEPKGSVVEPFGSYQVVRNGCLPGNSSPASCPYTIYTSGIWAGGIDENANKRVAASTYYSTSNYFDWYAGPLDGNGNPYNCADWDRVFQVKKEDLLALISNYQNGVFTGLDCNHLNDNIKYWPGFGNPQWKEKFNFDLPEQPLAAFYDYNENGIYDPCNGDLPGLSFLNKLPQPLSPDLIINNFPQQLSFWILNDNGGPHRLTSGNNIKMELHMYAYGFLGSDNISNTSFVNVRSFYKGQENLKDFYFGIWTDGDLGCYADDYIGIDTVYDMAYYYNTDAIDGNTGNICSGGVKTFTDEIPIVATMLLEGIKNDDNKNTGFTSAVVMVNPTGTSMDPAVSIAQSTDEQFYNVLKGHWRFGENLTYGGNGYNLASTDTVKFLFTDAPDDINGWSMCSNNLPLDDRNVAMSTGGVNLLPGAVKEFTFAYLYQPVSNLPCPDISDLQDIAAEIKSFHDNFYIVTSISDDILNDNLSYIKSMLNEFRLKEIKENLEIVIIDINGKEMERFDTNLDELMWTAPDHYLNGMYLVQLTSKSGSKAVFKQVVMR